MANRNETLRLTPEALSEGLIGARLTLRQFCHLFDVGYENARRWMLPDDHARALEPPYWITPMLAMLRNPATKDIAIACRVENNPTAEDHAHAD